jgi:pimeloyl-ACP methyl ester carboxylesterase
MKTIKVLGQNDERLKAVGFGSNLKNFTVSDAVQISTDRAAANYQYIKDLQDDDVVELIFEDNIHRWVKVSELEKDYKYSLLRGEAEGVIEIPSQLPGIDGQQASRGVTAWVLKGLRVLKYDPVEKAAGKIARTWDAKLMPEPGLYRYGQGLLKRGEELNSPVIDAKKPILLFLHGTFSSTVASFGKLPQEVWARLSQKYGDLIFGYDHHTLSESPIQNALDLTEKLPEGAILHLVTHSRGGLIGELLSRSGRNDGQDAFDETDLRLVATNVDAEAGNTDLGRLSNLLRDKKIRVEHFVRIACPARGTTLASGRPDRWLELIVNVLAKALEPTGAGTLFSILTDLMLELKKQAANPEAIPGLAAMVPESNFIRMINRPDVQVDSDLCVIAGDVEKNDILGSLAVFFADLFYSEDHDLVVQTQAMYGGSPRKDGLYYFHKGTEVNHFHYFSNHKTAEKIMEALTFNGTERTEKGFRPISEAYGGQAVAVLDLVSRSFQKRSNLPQPVVYVVPGIMGSHLSEGASRIWLDLLELAQGKITSLEITRPDIHPESLVASAYSDLVDYLSSTHEVIPFPYDWRMSILDEAKRFAQVIETKLGETQQPIRIVAHSMGGLITRAMISLRPDVWERMCERDGARFVMLGTPNRGAHKITRLVLGQEKILSMLALLDIHNSRQRLLEVITHFPGILQLLPVYDTTWNFLDANTWNKFPNTGQFVLSRPQQKDLDGARYFQDVLNSRSIQPEEPIIYVAGFAPGAPSGISLSDRGEVQFLSTDEGDGTVTWQSGILPELENRTWYMHAKHGDMAKHRPSFAAIYDLLSEGKTTRLFTTRPQVKRGVEDTYILRAEAAEIFPVQIDLEQAVLDAGPVTLPTPAEQPVRVSVAHGNLSFCNNPVAVGHYEGDGIFSAERALDYHLKGKLSNRHRLGRYPGPDGTAEVILNEADHKPGGAIIVGLGKAGELSNRKLTQAFASAMREYGVMAAENKRLGPQGELAVSTLLIGAGGMGISVANSVDAILSGVEQANRSFAQQAGSLQNVRISEIQFIELYKDQAILATRALSSYADRAGFAVNTQLRTLRGGLRRLAYEESPGWWSRIYVRAGKDNSLIFTLPTDRARAEESQQGLQKTSIETLIAQAVGNAQWDQSLASTIFELIVPNRLKGSFRDLNNAVLVLDPEAAHYPWELIYDRRAGQDKPLVVQVGMIRQFSTATFQEHVVDVTNKNILVVGNPANLPDGFGNLPGAQQEASLVAAKFEEFGYKVIPEINTGSASIMNKLFANDYRVLHLAGHGVFRYPVRVSDSGEKETYTGMVLGNNVFLTANEIKNKMEIPELVFINCCHLGKLNGPNRPGGYEFNKLAASLSEELIEMGVRAVIAAGWAVDDAAALTFADVFYDYMLKGYTFGNAVKEARIKTYELHKDRTNTWGAYQCYGDPAYRLVAPREGAAGVSDKFVDIEEAIVQIRQLSRRAETSSAEGLASLRNSLLQMLKRLQEECPASWLKESRVQEALGEVFGDVFLFDRAVEYYRMALENEICGASIRTIEQLANFNIRLAVQAFENDPRQYQKSKAIIEAQIQRLTALMETVGETTERRSMIGSGYKRLALIASSKSSKVCDQALGDMEQAYQLAWDRAPNNPYPAANLLAAKVTRLLRTNDPAAMVNALPELDRLVKEAASLAEAEVLNAPDDFWASVSGTDIKLVGYLVKYIQSGCKDLSAELFDGLADEYSTTWLRYGSARELNSVIEHYTFLLAVLKKAVPDEEITGYLERPLSALKTMSG